MIVSGRLLATLVGAFVTMPVMAHAAPIAPVRVEMAPDNACGDAASLEARMVARGVAVSSTAETIATVDVRAKGDDIEGSLVLTRETGTTSRVVRATTCADVLDALVFTLGLALEDVASPESPGAAPRRPTFPPSRTADRVSAPVRGGGLDLELGVGGGVERTVAPTVSRVTGAWVLVGARRPTRLSPSAALGVAFGLPVATTVGATKATSATQAGILDLCPVRLGGTHLGVRPCARTMIGRAQVRSEGFVGAQLDERMLVTVGAALRGDAKVAGPLFAHVELAATIPLSRATYFVAGSKIFETPAVALAGGAGIAVHFP